ncbi:DUF5065 domain-containing protein [Bacillus anthracis]|uniref:DUF5065 family protein n=1 Tax=Bacillus TaxID=1386 RepID=UPI0008FDFAC0|nr:MULTISPECIES: DUF5065 family protein [Bacillus]PEF46056.1 DUF5065 domain-containing protein [Bacillus cereus]PEU79804.1 DUF5065 domain-containing protein [Bacillus anthracis]MDE7549732.1 DUF5065 family protein [Bacillus tropicus]MDE7569964.1 DUF5065 family protein [Bacillus tropicus]OJD61933.1 DUF5065 domain-containing protein [Bacillus sp. N35-10-4]
MKSFKVMALAGTLALGGVTAVELLQPSIQAQAAVIDNWPYKYFPELHNVTDSAVLNLGNLKHGQTINIKTNLGARSEATVKIYRVMDDFSLARYKTITDSDSNENTATFTTQITSAYDPGNYVAVMQYSWESEGQMNYTYFTGEMFTISK